MQSGLKQRQRGATFLGMVTILSILGMALYAGIRLVPLYMDNMSVVKAMNDVERSLQGGDVSPASIRKALNARWVTDYITTVDVADIEIAPVADGIEMRAAYEARAPFVANVFLVVEFDKSVVISTRGP